ncbi:MAG: hypothetical protein ACK4YP_05855 [Myxococcota bacterium]
MPVPVIVAVPARGRTGRGGVIVPVVPAVIVTVIVGVVVTASVIVVVGIGAAGHRRPANRPGALRGGRALLVTGRDRATFRA